MVDMNSLRANFSSDRSKITLLPDPEPEELWCPFVSVDDHLVEPLDLFDRVPSALRSRAPRVEYDDDGLPAWIVGDNRFSILISDGAVGRPRDEWNMAPQKLEEFRDGVHDIHARVSDMDVIGAWASLNFPSTVFGFAGTQLARLDPDVGLACVRAYNDWVIEEWCGAYPDRLIPCQLPWLPDPAVAAQEVYRNAERGFRAVTFSENPTGQGHPSVHTTHWDPFFRACEETGTVVNLHVGSSGDIVRPTNESPSEVSVALFVMSGMVAATDWIYARIPLRFPELKIALSEAGVSWVPTAIERLRRGYRQRDASAIWSMDDPDPAELLLRNFWFTSIEDPSAFRQLDIIGEDNVMVESDYPHKDSSWPETQSLLRGQLEHLTTEQVRKICYQNACDLYRHPEPPPALLASSAVGAGAESRP